MAPYPFTKFPHGTARRKPRRATLRAAWAAAHLNLPTGAGIMQYHDIGVAVYPFPSLVLKFNYTRAVNSSPLGAQADSVLGGVGFLF